VVLCRPGRCGPVAQVRGFGRYALWPDGLMIANALLPLSGPITWMPD
jgi:hypothetical protein